MTAAVAAQVPEAVATATRVAARAVRAGRMPRLGSVRHGSQAAALAGCPCARCERLREDLAADGAGQTASASVTGEGTAAGRPETRGPYLGPTHPLADAARARCRRQHGAAYIRGRLGTVACGPCWEAAIRADERLVVHFGLPAQPPAPDPGHVDEVALERAGYGDRVRLSDAERAELARRVYAGRVPWRTVERLGVSGERLRTAAGRAPLAGGTR